MELGKRKQHRVLVYHLLKSHTSRIYKMNCFERPVNNSITIYFRNQRPNCDPCNRPKNKTFNSSNKIIGIESAAMTISKLCTRKVAIRADARSILGLAIVAFIIKRSDNSPNILLFLDKICSFAFMKRKLRRMYSILYCQNMQYCVRLVLSHILF